MKINIFLVDFKGKIIQFNNIVSFNIFSGATFQKMLQFDNLFFEKEKYSRFVLHTKNCHPTIHTFHTGTCQKFKHFIIYCLFKTSYKM